MLINAVCGNPLIPDYHLCIWSAGTTLLTRGYTHCMISHYLVEWCIAIIEALVQPSRVCVILL